MILSKDKLIQYLDQRVSVIEERIFYGFYLLIILFIVLVSIDISDSFLPSLAAVSIAAGGGKWLKDKFYKPKIHVSIKLEPPDSLLIPSEKNNKYYPIYYFRLKVENSGNKKIEDLEAVALELFKKNLSGIYDRVNSFLPMKMQWANKDELRIPVIQPGLFQHCNLGKILEYQETDSLYKVVFILATEATPNTLSNFLFPGEYKIKLAFAANNLRPEYHEYYLSIRNKWDLNQEIEFSENISIIAGSDPAYKKLHSSFFGGKIYS